MPSTITQVPGGPVVGPRGGGRVQVRGRGEDQAGYDRASRDRAAGRPADGSDMPRQRDAPAQCRPGTSPVPQAEPQSREQREPQGRRGPPLGLPGRPDGSHDRDALDGGVEGARDVDEQAAVWITVRERSQPVRQGHPLNPDHDALLRPAARRWIATHHSRGLPPSSPITTMRSLPPTASRTAEPSGRGSAAAASREVGTGWAGEYGWDGEDGWDRSAGCEVGAASAGGSGWNRRLGRVDT